MTSTGITGCVGLAAAWFTQDIGADRVPPLGGWKNAWRREGRYATVKSRSTCITASAVEWTEPHDANHPSRREQMGTALWGPIQTGSRSFRPALTSVFHPRDRAGASRGLAC